MKLVIIGASGFIGSALTREALSRGHQVLAVVRDSNKLQTQLADLPAASLLNLQISSTDVFNSAALTPVLQGADAVISAFSGHSASDVSSHYQAGFASILAAVHAAKVRLLLVGGAASLQLPDGSRLLDSPNFPAAYRGSAEGAWAALQQLQQQTTLEWSYLSPAAEIFPGPASGEYRLGGDQLLTDAQGASRISTGDYAKALLNEAEQPAHRQRRFSIAY